MSLEELAEIDAVLEDIDTREDERFKFLGECLMMGLKRAMGV